jgi:MoxR-like ATPase
MSKYLQALEVYGFDKVEPAILASLVTEDPLLLIGRSGTGKTFLLNSLSEELGLEHRHYNASLISFDDLVGFPFPDADKGGVKFLETPATVWGAESVLVDEISRCKPEHQNRLFSLVHERKVQGIPISKLRYRWAAMNPVSNDQSGLEEYAGSEPLDPALADRFSLLVWAVDWSDLSDEERTRIADPRGEGRTSNDGGKLKKRLGKWRKQFVAQLKNCPEFVLTYTTTVVTALNSAGVRMSPRRSRLMSRSLLAAEIITGKRTEVLYKMMLKCSLPQVAWGDKVEGQVINASHRLAWDSASEAEGRWIHTFMAEGPLAKKLDVLVTECKDQDAGTQAIAQFMASEPRERQAAFAFVTCMAAVMGKLPIGAEGVNDLSKAAKPVLTVDANISWQERLNQQDTKHPEFDRLARVSGKLEGGRRDRAEQFFSWCLVKDVRPQDPAALEADINACVELLVARGLV